MLEITGGMVSTSAAERTAPPAETSKYSATIVSPLRARNCSAAGGLVAATSVTKPRNSPGRGVSNSVIVWLLVNAGLRKVTIVCP